MRLITAQRVTVQPTCNRRPQHPPNGLFTLVEASSGLEFRPGQEVAVIRYRGRVELVPIEPAEKMRGFLRGIDPGIGRESDLEL